MLLIGVLFLYKEDIFKFYADHFIAKNKIVTLQNKNEYFQNQSFNFVQVTDNFSPTSMQDLLNIYYTVIDSGNSSFSFYCPEAYVNCIDDVKALANDQTTLSNINNFVHPFNGFKHIETEYDSIGKVTIRLEKTYTSDKIKAVNEKVETVYKEEVMNKSTDEDKIKAAHDYIINNSKYDKDRSDKKLVQYDSDTAYGNLIQGYGLCGGYTDSMALFLDKIGVKNFKVASDNHVWNAVLLDNVWYHLDLTWDDPVTTDGKDILEYNFFLITTDELQTLEDAQHNFNAKVYSELN